MCINNNRIENPNNNIVREYKSRTTKKGQDGGYSYNHPKGINAENRVNMSYRDNAERTVGRRVYQQKYTRNGMTRYYNINTNNPIIKVSKSLNR